MSGTLIAILLWVGMCAGFFVLATINELIDKLCEKYPKLARWFDEQ